MCEQRHNIRGHKDFRIYTIVLVALSVTDERNQRLLKHLEKSVSEQPLMG